MFQINDKGVAVNRNDNTTFRISCFFTTGQMLPFRLVKIIILPLLTVARSRLRHARLPKFIYGGLPPVKHKNTTQYSTGNYGDKM